MFKNSRRNFSIILQSVDFLVIFHKLCTRLYTLAVNQIFKFSYLNEWFAETKIFKFYYFGCDFLNYFLWPVFFPSLNIFLIVFKFFLFEALFPGFCLNIFLVTRILRIRYNLKVLVYSLFSNNFEILKQVHNIEQVIKGSMLPWCKVAVWKYWNTLYLIYCSREWMS